MNPVSRRDFLGRCATAAAVLPFAGWAEPEPGERPNILWLVSEDSSPMLGCYGDPVARTPVLDALAKKGIVFDACYAMPVCAPSRFTLITGMYPTTCGPAQHMRAQGKIPAWLKGFPARTQASLIRNLEGKLSTPSITKS